MSKTKKEKQKERKKQRRKAAVKKRYSATETMLKEKLDQHFNREKLIASLDPKAGEFARREFAKLGLF